MSDTDKQTKIRVNGFLKDLTKLSKRYKIKIGGCGCCGSPYLTVFEANSTKQFTDKHKYIVKDSNSNNVYDALTFTDSDEH